MRQIRRLLPVVCAIVVSLGVVAAAEPETSRLELRGVFVKLAEQRVGESEYLAIVVKPFDSDEHYVVLVPREPEHVAEVARKLRPGTKLEIAYLRDGGHNWLRGIEAAWDREGDGEKRQERMVVRVEREGREVEREVEREGSKRVLRSNTQGFRSDVDRFLEADREEARRREASRPERREGEAREGLAGRIERLVMQFRELAGQVARMEREIRELRAENERLRRMLGERGEREPRREMEGPMERREHGERETERLRRERGGNEVLGEGQRDILDVIRERGGGRGRDREPLPRLPDSLAGFKGILRGQIVRKMDRGFVLSLTNVNRVWEENKAENPRAAVGKTMVVMIRPEAGGGEQFMRTLRALRVGQNVSVEAFHLEGEHLTVVEQLIPMDLR